MSDDPATVTLPMIPEPTWIKEAYQRGELTEDEALDLLIFGHIDPRERKP